MSAIGLIPARFASQRFPGKPLARIAGRPMIEWVWRGACTAERLARVAIATDDDRITDACRAFGAECIRTSPDHATGTDRLDEAAERLALADDDIVVNVQGDEPLIEGRAIDAVVEALEADAGAVASTAVHRARPEDLDDPNRVKAVLDRNGRALWFSRAAIPAVRDPRNAPIHWQHIGIYGYRRSFLRRFVTLPRTPAEKSEALEQLRILEHGHAIRAAIIEDWDSVAVDTPGDVKAVEDRLKR